MRELTRAFYSGEVSTVEVPPGIEQLWVVLRLADRQWRTGMAGPTGVDLLALVEIARGYGVQRTPRFFELVKVYEEEALKTIREKVKGAESAKECSEAEKRMCMEQFGEHFEWACKNCEKKREKVADA